MYSWGRGSNIPHPIQSSILSRKLGLAVAIQGAVVRGSLRRGVDSSGSLVGGGTRAKGACPTTVYCG